MADIRVNPTRMELKRYQARTATARRGHKLLKDKLDELMRLYLDTVRENRALREDVRAALGRACGGFALAGAVSSPKMLREALILPGREGELEISYRNLMGVQTPKFEFRIKTADPAANGSYGMAFTSGELDTATRELNAVLEKLLRMAELEKTAQLLEVEIERTRRRVNALEYILIPRYLEITGRIRMRLEENERENITRLMKIKDLSGRGNSRCAEEDEEDAEKISE